jgi:undecaprenyl-diphosphatase
MLNFRHVVLDSDYSIQSNFPSAKMKRVGIKFVVGWSLFALLLIAVSLPFDNAVERLTSVKSSPQFRSFAWFMSKIGEGWVIAVAGCVMATILGLKRRHAAARWVLIAAIVGLSTGATATVLRSLVGRTRPNASVEQGVYGPYHKKLIIGKYEYSSFPSGHTATVFGLAAAVWFFSRKVGILAFAYATLVGWSRIAQGSHHFSDVVAATLLGILGAYFILARWGPRLDAFMQRILNACFRNRKPITP